jgi:hypothetical protein
MNQPSKFDRKVAIAVEGTDFFHLLRVYGYDLEKTDDVRLYDFKETDLRKWLDTFNDRKSDSPVKVLGIICDAEDNSENMFRSVSGDLRKASLAVPSKITEIVNKENLAVAVFIVPVNENEGCIEYSLLNAVADENYLKCAEDFQRCVETFCGEEIRGNEKSLERWRSKVKVHALIAGSKQPEMSLGTSVKHGIWNFEKPSLKAIIDFIEKLRKFAEEN